MPIPQSVAILGAGLTGLTAAHRLHQFGCLVRVFEQSGRAGGLVGTERVDGWLIERGPQSLLSGEPALTALIAELGLGDQVCPANLVARNRYILRAGRPLPLPRGPLELLRTPLFSSGTKCRLVAELCRRPHHRPEDISLSQLIAEHFGREAVDYGLNPFVGGVYAGDPDQLSARLAFPGLWEAEQRHGSIIRGMLAAAKRRQAAGRTRGGIISFRDGLQTLTDALVRRLPPDALRLNTTVAGIHRGARWRVLTAANNDDAPESFDAVISTLPPRALSRLALAPDRGRPLASLADVATPPVAVLFLGYHRSQLAHPLNGFGLLVPAVERRSVLGVLFSSTLFPGRAPADHAALTVMIGGSRQPELPGLPAHELLLRVQPDLAQLLGVHGQPVFQRLVTWTGAITQYNLGYERFLDTMQACETAHPGFLIGGQLRDGIALPARIAAGEALARRLRGN